MSCWASRASLCCFHTDEGKKIKEQFLRYPIYNRFFFVGEHLCLLINIPLMDYNFSIDALIRNMLVYWQNHCLLSCQVINFNCIDFTEVTGFKFTCIGINLLLNFRGSISHIAQAIPLHVLDPAYKAVLCNLFNPVEIYKQNKESIYYCIKE